MKKKVNNQFCLSTIMLIVLIFLGLNTIAQSEIPKAENGFLDLSNWDFEKDGLIALDGKWEFYWQQLITPHEFETGSFEPDYMYVPQGWTSGKHDCKKYPNFGYATYRLLINLPSNNESLRLKIRIGIYSTSIIFINGRQVSGSGILSTTTDKEKPANTSFVKIFTETLIPRNTDNAEIVIQVSNHVSAGKHTGISEKISIGPEQKILKTNNRALMLNSMFIGALIIMSIYHLFLFFYRKN